MKLTIRTSDDIIIDGHSTELDVVDQEFDSAATSINSTKLPAIYKLIDIPSGTVGVDFGGGRFDNAIEHVADLGATLCVYDPYNRSREYNAETLQRLRENGGADWAVNSNVLNVIKEPEARAAVLRNIKKIAKSGAPIYITVYEGRGDNNGGPTKSGYQLNRKTADYLDEVQTVFPDAQRKGKLIVAHNIESVMSSEDVIATTKSSAFTTRLLRELQSEVLSCMVDLGFTESEAADYFVVEVAPTEVQNEIKAEVRAELEYSELTKLIDRLDPIIDSYGDGYFEPVAPGIIECYIQLKPSTKCVPEYTHRQTMTCQGQRYAVSSSDVCMDSDEAGAKKLQADWKFQVSKITPYDDADYYYAIGGEGVVKYYRGGKLQSKQYYDDADELDMSNTAWMQAVIEDVVTTLAQRNSDITPKYIHNSATIRSSRFRSVSSFDPPDEDTPSEYAEETCYECSLDGVQIIMDSDGYYEYKSTQFIEKGLDEPEGLFTEVHHVFIRDVFDLLSDLDDLLDMLLPTESGTYELSGHATLVYHVSGIQLYLDSYDLDDYDVTVVSDHMDVDLDGQKSKVSDFSCKKL